MFPSPRRFLLVLPVLGASLCVLASGPSQAQTLPVADAGPDQAISCAAPEGAEVPLDGSASSDPDDPAAVLVYTWTSPSLLEPVPGAMPVVLLPAGDHVLTLTVDDGVDGTATDDVLVQVAVDDVAPILELSQSSAELWPPNHKYHVFSVGDFVATATDDCSELGAADVVFDRVASDEPEDGIGDGNTTDDVLLAYGCNAALIRAERMGPGDGRVYEATLALRDAAGNAAEQVVTISVPKSQGAGGAAVDSGDVYSVGSESCAAVELCPAVPAEDCLPAEEGQLALRSRGERDSLRWSARGVAAGQDDMAEGEDGADYQVCLYVDDGLAASVASDPAAPAGEGWRTSRKGQSYRAKGDRRAAGLHKLKLRSRGAETQVRAAARGEGLELPELPLDEGALVRVQLWNSDGMCIEAAFADPHVNRPGRYKAKLR